MAGKNRRQIQYTVPLVHVVLMDFGGDGHFRDALPKIQLLSIVPDAYLPLVGAGAERERREGVGEEVDAGFERELLGGAGPHQLALGIEERDAVLATGDGLGQLDDEIDGDGPERGEKMWLIGRRTSDFPLKETALRGEGAVPRWDVAVAAGHGGFIGGGDFVGGAVLADRAIVDPDDAVAKSPDLIELMGDEDDGAAGAGDVTHLSEAFLLEIDIANGEDFIDEENFRLEMGGDGKGQADVHAGGVVLDGSVDEFFELGEGHDFVEFAGDFALAHAQDGAGEESVFAAGEFGVEAGADFEEAADAAADFGVASGGAGDLGEDFEQGGLAGAVAADEAEDFAFANVEGDVFEGPEGFLGGAAERF